MVSNHYLTGFHRSNMEHHMENFGQVVGLAC